LRRQLAHTLKKIMNSEAISGPPRGILKTKSPSTTLKSRSSLPLLNK
jgi:hypothetical protein